MVFVKHVRYFLQTFPPGSILQGQWNLLWTLFLDSPVDVAIHNARLYLQAFDDDKTQVPEEWIQLENMGTQGAYIHGAGGIASENDNPLGRPPTSEQEPSTTLPPLYPATCRLLLPLLPHHPLVETKSTTVVLPQTIRPVGEGLLGDEGATEGTIVLTTPRLDPSSRICNI